MLQWVLLLIIVNTFSSILLEVYLKTLECTYILQYNGIDIHVQVILNYSLLYYMHTWYENKIFVKKW